MEPAPLVEIIALITTLGNIVLGLRNSRITKKLNASLEAKAQQEIKKIRADALAAYEDEIEKIRKENEHLFNDNLEQAAKFREELNRMWTRAENAEKQNAANAELVSKTSAELAAVKTELAATKRAYALLSGNYIKWQEEKEQRIISIEKKVNRVTEETGRLKKLTKGLSDESSTSP